MATQRRIGESTRSTTIEEEEEMAEKVKEYISTLPHRLNSTLSSLSPLSLSYDVSDSLPGDESCSGNSNRYLAAGEGETTADDIKLLNAKFSSNISAIPKVLKRMNDCISRIGGLVSSNETIHPTFKRKRSG